MDKKVDLTEFQRADLGIGENTDILIITMSTEEDDTKGFKHITDDVEFLRNLRDHINIILQTLKLKKIKPDGERPVADVLKDNP